jgi:hypothetical protein
MLETVLLVKVEAAAYVPVATLLSVGLQVPPGFVV